MEVFQRLAHVAKPVHYILHIKPDLDKFQFDGDATIEIKVLAEINELKLYSKDINVKHARLINSSGNEFDNIKFEYNTRWDTVTFMLPEALPMGSTAKLGLTFSGLITDKMRGFYRSKYTDAETGKDAWMVVTQFAVNIGCSAWMWGEREQKTHFIAPDAQVSDPYFVHPADARLAFPCFDEPCYKATFDLSLTVPATKCALSCMSAIEETNNADGTKTVRFARTPPMSSYVLAYAVGDLEYVEDMTESGVQVRVYTTKGKRELGKFSLEVAAKALSFYTDYFDIPYALDKCDLLAVPDCEFNAMENWGLITFRDLCLLFDPAQSSKQLKQRCAEVVGHELAHMWFGNLVTMHWWTDIWLNEGFATYMAYLFTSKAYPSFDMWNQFVQEATQSGMALDALKNSHPIEIPINDPDEMNEIFDAITYRKSSSILRMIASYLGEEAYRKGLRSYLKRFKFANAETSDLWHELSQACGHDVAAIMNTWTGEMGFPVVEVDRCLDACGKTMLRLRQTRFLADGSDDSRGALWQIPITLSTSADAKMIVWRGIFNERSAEVVVNDVKESEWIKLNIEFSGYYRVQYSDDMLCALAIAVSLGTLGSVDRFSLFSDTFALFVAGKISAASLFGLLTNYRDETDYNVWANIVDAVDTLSNVLGETEHAGAFDAFVRWLFRKIHAKLGWDAKADEAHGDVLLRPLVLNRLGRSREPKVLAEAKRRFDAYVSHMRRTGESDPTLAPDIRAVVFSLAAQEGGESAMNDILHIYANVDISEVKNTCLSAMGKSTDATLQLRALKLCLTDTVRVQDITFVTSGVACGISRSAKQTVWDFLAAHFSALAERFGSTSGALFIRMIKSCMMSNCSDTTAAEMTRFFEKYVADAASLRRPVEQSIERVRLNAAMLRRADAIGVWLSLHKPHEDA